jgi:hypothetical protein
MKPTPGRPLRLALFHATLILLAAAGPPAQAQPPLPGVREVGQAIEWTGFFEPTTLHALGSVRFVGRGVVEDESGRVIGRLSLVANVQGSVASVEFPALDGVRVRVALLDGTQPVGEVTIQTGSLGAPAVAGPSGRAAAPVTAFGQVTIDPAGGPATMPRSVKLSLDQQAGPGSASGAVVPAPLFELDLGVRTQVIVGGLSRMATKVRFLADTPFPPPGFSGAILQQVEVLTDSLLGGGPPPSLQLTAEQVVPGVLFSGVPVQLLEGRLFPDFDAVRGLMDELALTGDDARAALVSGQAAGVAATWDGLGGDLGGSVELAAIGQNIASVEVRGVVVATQGEEGWDLWFRPPGGLGGLPWAVEVDGEAVAQVTVQAPESMFASVAEPPSGAAVFPLGLGEGAFYGFSWREPVAIEVPGAGTFTGRELRLVFPQPIGPLAFGGLAIHQLSQLRLTGLAAPAVDGGPCFASTTRLCLAAGRFAVDVAWADPFGGSGPGVAVPLTEDTGAFWFFSEENLELMVKVLDACPVNGHAWVFAGGLTNVEVELTVTDTRTGDLRVYRNAQGQASQPIQDTAAFLCTP